MIDEARQLLLFVEKAERLKTIYRHSWTSDITRQESVADHSWMLALLAIVLPSLIDTEADAFRLLKMVVVHDLAEAVTGDIPAFQQQAGDTSKYEKEKIALQKIVADLPSALASEIIGLWEEYEQKQTVEAKLAQAIDKAEVLIQHNIADASSWDQGDYDLGVYYRDNYFDFDKFLRALKDEINKNNWHKLSEAGTIHHLPEAQIERGAKEFGSD